MGNYRSDLVDLQVDYLHDTEKGLLVSPDGKKEVWLAKSLVECELKGVRRGTCIEITLPESYAKEKGLI